MTNHKIKKLKTKKRKDKALIYCPKQDDYAVVFMSGFDDDSFSSLGKHVHCPLCKEVISI